MTLKIFAPNAARDRASETGDVAPDLGHHALSLSAPFPWPHVLENGWPHGAARWH